MDPSTNLYTEEKKVYKTQWILNYTNISSEKGIQIPMVTMLYMMVTKLYKNPYGNQPTLRCLISEHARLFIIGDFSILLTLIWPWSFIIFLRKFQAAR